MSETEIQLVESRISKMLTARGYQLSGLPLIEVNSAFRQWLKLQNWWARVHFRINRIGFSLFLFDYLSRHLGLKEWQKSIKLKLNAINTAYLK